MKYYPCKFMVAASLALTLNACGAAADVRRDDQPMAGRTFSEEDKRIARYLSIGNEIMTTRSTPQFEAALCGLALETIAEQLRQSGSLSPRQLQAFERAQGIFRARAQTGLTPQERAKTRREVEAAYPDRVARARVAMGCLRGLA